MCHNEHALNQLQECHLYNPKANKYMTSIRHNMQDVVLVRVPVHGVTFAHISPSEWLVEKVFYLLPMRHISRSGNAHRSFVANRL